MPTYKHDCMQVVKTYVTCTWPIPLQTRQTEELGNEGPNPWPQDSPLPQGGTQVGGEAPRVSTKIRDSVPTSEAQQAERRLTEAQCSKSPWGQKGQGHLL